VLSGLFQVINFFEIDLNLLILDFLRFQYPAEYSKPKVAAAYPGPKHQEMIDSVQSYNLDQAYQVQRFVSAKQSKGNFFVDVDGNVVLDLHCNFSNLPLGYNHDAYINVISNSVSKLLNRKDKVISMIALSATESTPLCCQPTTIPSY